MSVVNEDFISRELIDGLEKCSPNRPLKLLEFCKTINDNYVLEHYLAVVVIVRGILDYVPTIFGFTNTGELYSNLKGNQSFKNALKEVNQSVRSLADDALHNPAQSEEILKISKIIVDSLNGNLAIIIDSVTKQLSSADLRDAGNKKIAEKRDNAMQSREPKTQLDTFEEYITGKDWIEEYFDGRKVWICKADNLYQIHERDDYGDFSEPWTTVYPDSHGSGKHSVDLVYNAQQLKRLQFVYCDGGRISVALPDIDIDKADLHKDDGVDRRTFYWEKDSIEYKLTKLIGSFYIYKDIEGVAERSGIEIR
jgi:hypothetical protein